MSLIRKLKAIVDGTGTEPVLKPPPAVPMSNPNGRPRDVLYEVGKEPNPSLSEEDTLKVVDAWEELEKELSKELDIDSESIRDSLVDYFIGVEPEENQLVPPRGADPDVGPWK